MIPEIILLFLEIAGTIVFAVSGALVAIKSKFDIFGVLVIGCVTAVGGGMTRDILIGSTPPAIFSKLYIVCIAAVTALCVFIIAYFYGRKFDVIHERIEPINNVFDAIGLGVFSITGTELAFVNGLSDNVFLSITLGVLTGVGGGLLRDIMTKQMPYIFTKHVYALASIFGTGLYYMLRLYFPETVLPSIFSILLIVVVRLLAAKYRWSLPKVQLEEKEKKAEKKPPLLEEIEEKA